VIITACSELCKVLFFGAVCDVFGLYMKYLGELLERFVPNSQGRRVWSLAWTSLNVMVKVKVIVKN